MQKTLTDTPALLPGDQAGAATAGQDAAHPRKLFIRPFGCQMNEYDSDKMADILHEDQGLERTDNPVEADVILFNTCSVRENAPEKVFSDLGRVHHLDRKSTRLNSS